MKLPVYSKFDFECNAEKRNSSIRFQINAATDFVQTKYEKGVRHWHFPPMRVRTHLSSLLKTLAKSVQCLLRGKSNQIVHPNFYSWAAVRAQFQMPLVFSVHVAK